MHTCKICLKQFKTLRFRSPRVCVCGRCSNDLNNYHEVAESAYMEVRELLLIGMLRRGTIDTYSPSTPIWRQKSAARIIENIDAEVDRVLPGWINKLLAKKSNKTKFFKMIRAHRRGLLHLNRPDRWGYPKNWKEIAKKIRELDKSTCVNCSARDTELHVHHIVYASNFGTHQMANSVTLCRRCHEKEHERVFDFGENMVTADELPLNARESDPEFFSDGVVLTLYHVEAGTVDFSRYADLMIEDVGEGVKPYLLSFWEKARRCPDLDTSAMTGKYESAQQFQNLIKSHEL